MFNKLYVALGAPTAGAGLGAGVASLLSAAMPLGAVIGAVLAALAAVLSGAINGKDAPRLFRVLEAGKHTGRAG